MQVLVALALAFVLVGGVVAAGAMLRDDDGSAASPASTTTSSSTTTTSTLPPTTTPTIPAVTQPPIAELPEVPYDGYGKGTQNDAILLYEQRLLELKFDPGAVDGLIDQATVYALEAVQKIMGYPRSGRLGPGEARALAAFNYPVPLHGLAEGNRTEIDVTKQVITLYENYQVKLITTTSTASGETFCYITPKKAPTARICEVATTPNGRFQYYFYYDGWHEGDLGGLYNPYYFFKGRAIHGYESVPTEPASHGCARVPMHIAEYWHTLVHDGDAVYVDGGTDGEQIISSTPV
jgi:peptidoglycan hydrolase-like protein with peptidoglycan-binding domain